MRYILTKDYQVTKVKNNMVGWNKNAPAELYMYLHPEEHFGYKVIHKDNVLLVAKNLKDLVKQIKANEEIRSACLEAWKEYR